MQPVNLFPVADRANWMQIVNTADDTKVPVCEERKNEVRVPRAHKGGWKEEQKESARPGGGRGGVVGGGEGGGEGSVRSNIRET